MSKPQYQSTLVKGVVGEPSQLQPSVTTHALMESKSGPLQQLKTKLHQSKLAGERDRELERIKTETEIKVGRKTLEIAGETLIGHIIEQGAGALQALQERLQAKETMGVIRLQEGHAMGMINQAASLAESRNALEEQARSGRTTAENYQRDSQRLVEADHLVATHTDGIFVDALKQTRTRFARASDHTSK